MDYIEILNNIKARDRFWTNEYSEITLELIKEDFGLEYLKEFVKDIIKLKINAINPEIKNITPSIVYVNYKRYYTIRDNGRKLKEAQKSTQG